MVNDWTTVDKPKHPIKNGRWVQITEIIRENSTGIIREHLSDTPLEDNEAHPNTWIYEEGNFACDCNRALFFGYAIGENMDEIERECGDGAYSVKLKNTKTGEIFYSEF